MRREGDFGSPGTYTTREICACGYGEPWNWDCFDYAMAARTDLTEADMITCKKCGRQAFWNGPVRLCWSCKEIENKLQLELDLKEKGAKPLSTP